MDVQITKLMYSFGFQSVITSAIIRLSARIMANIKEIQPFKWYLELSWRCLCLVSPLDSLDFYSVMHSINPAMQFFLNPLDGLCLKGETKKLKLYFIGSHQSLLVLYLTMRIRLMNHTIGLFKQGRLKLRPTEISHTLNYLAVERCKIGGV